MSTPLAPTLESFFSDRLLRQKRVSPNTIASYRDTFRLLLRFAEQQTGTRPAKLELTQLDATMIAAFLDHLETRPQKHSRTRNVRLGTIHSFFQYCALRHPDHAALIARVLAIPPKRSERQTVTFLHPEETKALLDAPDRTTWTGRRDHALLLCTVQTGLRVSEVTGLACADVAARRRRSPPRVREGPKGADRAADQTDGRGAQGLDARARRHARRPAVPDPHRQSPLPRRARAPPGQTPRHRPGACPTLRSKPVSMHILRHTSAMMLLSAGVDTSTIALWLGHEQERTTHIYLHADLAIKQKALDRATPPDARPGRYRPPDRLLAFLENL